MNTTFIRPLLEYADIVWNNCSIELKNDTGATKRCSIDRLMADLNWDTLAGSRRKHRLILFFKMKKWYFSRISYTSDSPATSSTICPT